MDFEDYLDDEPNGYLTAADILLSHNLKESKVCERAQQLSDEELDACFKFAGDYLQSEENAPHPAGMLGWERYERILKKAAILRDFCRAEMDFRDIAKHVRAETRACATRRI